MSTGPENWRTSACCGGPNKFEQRRPHHQIPQTTNNEVEAILVQGMKDLSFDQLQREQEDLHGVAGDTIEFGTEEVNLLLQCLKEHLNRIKHGTAFASAEARNPSYVYRRDFQIIFLRANRNDPKAAAEQMIKYFELKQKLFGEDKTIRDITSDDLDEDDMASLMTGSSQIGSVSDRAGRLIVWAFPSRRKGASALGETFRSQFYLGMQILQSMEDPSKGIVVVSYQVGEFQENITPNCVEHIKAGLAMPYNIAGYHFCFDSRSAVFLAKTVVAAMPAHLRVKTRIHYGSHQECQYLLSGFGIPREALPLRANNELDLTFHQFWIHQCTHQKEPTNQAHDKSTNSSLTRKSKGGNKNIEFLSNIWKGETPMENDVLCVGRRVNGKGNDRLMSLAILNAEAYDAGTPIERRIILLTIMEEIRSHGGRFLKLDTTNDKGWVKVGDAEMREKLCQTFRNLRYTRVSKQSKASRNGANNGSTNRNSPKSTNASTNTGTAGAAAPSTSGAGSSPPPNIVDEYRADDVLFGKLKNHEGNQRLRELVEGMAVQYDTANRGKKKELADQLMDKVRKKGGRFLKPVEDGRWEVVSDKVAAKKIGHHFRNLRRKQWR